MASVRFSKTFLEMRIRFSGAFLLYIPLCFFHERAIPLSFFHARVKRNDLKIADKQRFNDLGEN